MVNSASRKDGLFPLLTIIIVIADVVTKALVRANMALGQSIPPDGRFRLSCSTNTGGVFGLPLPSTFITIMTVIVIILIIWLYFHSLRNRTTQVGLGLVLGGAVGNLIDRIRFGKVTDFLDVRIWGNFHWPTFNIADASITIGVLILVLCLLIRAREAM